MREIKFRGKCVYTAEWIIGSLVINIPKVAPTISTVNKSVIGYTQIEYTVDESTVGQYTGLKDKNGVEIYEGDIVKISNHPFERSINIDGNYEVGYNDQMELCCGSWLLFRMKYYSEVIGNIYQNPELLEMGE